MKTLIPSQFLNLDDGESLFFARELEHILTRQFEVDYADIKIRQFVPTSNEAGPGAESITYNQFDKFGMAKIISDYGDDLPRADVKGEKFTSPVESLGISYGWSFQEIRSAMMAGRPLNTKKADAATRAHEEAVDEIGSVGNAAAGLAGFVNNASVPAASASQTSWLPATDPDLILGALNEGVSTMRSTTKQKENPNTLLLPPSQYTLIAQKRMTDLDVTILKFFLQTNPWITQVDEWHRLEGAGAGATDRMIFYNRDPSKLELQIPQEYEIFPVQERNLEMMVPTHSRIGGVTLYKPLSVLYRDDI